MEVWSDCLSTAMLRTSVDALVAFDTEGHIVFVNEAARGVFGYGEADLLGRAVDDIIPGCSRLADTATMPEAGTVARQSHALDGRTREGVAVPLSVVLTVVDWEGRRVVGAVVRDEMERRRMELAITLREDKVTAVAAHVETVTNDFNNTLGVILANLALAQEDVGPEHPASRKLDQIRTSTGRAAHFVQQILSEVALIPGHESRHVWAARLARARTRQNAAPVDDVSTPSVVAPARDGVERLGPASAVPNADQAPSALHVLLVDDEEPLLAAATKILERQGYRVTACTRPADAMPAFNADPSAFDLVIADYVMPGASGLDVAAEIRMRRFDLPILLVSGRLTEEVRAEAAAVGVLQVLPKPYSAATLLDIVRRLLDPHPQSLAS